MRRDNIEFKPAKFVKTTSHDLRPHISCGKHTWGDDFVVGELQSLYTAQGAVLFSARFTPGADDRGYIKVADAEFLLVDRNGNFFGKIVHQNPESWTSLTSDILDQFGRTGAGMKGRQKATFSCALLGTLFNGYEISVFFKYNWIGTRWKEVVVSLPKNELYVSYL